MAEQPDPDERADPSAGDLPLEDPRWIPLIPEYKRLAERLGSYQLATLDFTKAMADGVIRCMRRRVVDGGCELLPPGIWAILYLGPDLHSGTVMIFPRKISDRNVSGLVYYIWKPDIDKFWLRFELPPVPDQRLEANAAAIDPPDLPAPPEPSPAPINKPTGPLKQRVRAALLESRPLPDDGYTDWARRTLPDDNPHSVANILSKDKSMWKEAGGTPVRRGRKPHA
jgi:hypothetical protein